MFRTVNYLCAVLLMFAVVAGCTGSGEAEEAKKEETTMAEKDQPVDPADRREPVRSEDNAIVTLETNLGNLTLELWHDVAPAHADSFLSLTQQGFYDSTIFHRIIAGFMMQGGDPTGTGSGKASYMLPAEFSKEPHVEGTLSMARGRDPNSASCQFFVCFGPTPQLNNQYTVFGRLLKGYDVLHTIEKVPVQASAHGEKSSPVEAVQLIRAFESDAEGNPK